VTTPVVMLGRQKCPNDASETPSLMEAPNEDVAITQLDHLLQDQPASSAPKAGETSRGDLGREQSHPEHEDEGLVISQFSRARPCHKHGMKEDISACQDRETTALMASPPASTSPREEIGDEPVLTPPSPGSAPLSGSSASPQYDPSSALAENAGGSQLAMKRGLLNQDRLRPSLILALERHRGGQHLAVLSSAGRRDVAESRCIAATIFAGPVAPPPAGRGGSPCPPRPGRQPRRRHRTPPAPSATSIYKQRPAQARAAITSAPSLPARRRA
jgi:hypothetical protein